MAVYRVNGVAGLGGNRLTTVGNLTTEKSVSTFPGCTVTVYAAGTTTLSTLYADNALTPKANPFTSSSSDASYFFYAAQGNYDVHFSGTGVSVAFTLGDVLLNTAEMIADQTPTGQWFANQGAHVNRITDRLLVGGAAVGDGNAPNADKDWLEALRGSGVTLSGTVNTAGTAVTKVSGDAFLTTAGWPGQSIIINSVRYVISAVTDASHLTLTSTAGVQSGVAYSIGVGILQGGLRAQCFVSNDPTIVSPNEPLNSGIGILNAIQTISQTTDGAASYAGCDVIVNNNRTNAIPVWARYIEAHRMNSAPVASGYDETTGVEIEVRNSGGLSNPVFPNPWTSSTTGYTSTLQLGAGAGLSATGQYNVTSALEIFPNPMKFSQGILFGAGSVANSGPGSSTAALLMPRDYGIQWYTSTAGGTLAAQIYEGGVGEELHLTGTDGVFLDGKTIISSGWLSEPEGAVLAISSNTIAPTSSIHHVGAGLIKTITVPTGFISGTVTLIPNSAFTYDATGNIIGTGTAVIGRVMTATYSSSSSKWYMSY